MRLNAKVFGVLVGAVVGIVIGFGMQLQGLGLVLAGVFGAGAGLASAPTVKENPVMKVSGLRWRRKRRRTPRI